MTATMFRVTAVRDDALGVKSFRLARFDRRKVAPFKAGAHVTVTVKDAGSGLQGTRAFTLTSRPHDDDAYEITVGRGDASGGAGMNGATAGTTGTTGGSASIAAFFHDYVKPGRVLTVSEPVQGFALAHGAARHVLIAGGIGVTPIVAFARELAARGADFDVHYSARSRERMAFVDELDTLSNGRLALAVTGGPDGRRLDAAAILRAAGPGAHVYVCGPAGMIADVQEAARALGWARERVHSESFTAAPSFDDRPIRLVLARSARTLDVTPRQTMLDALLAAGVAVDYDCRHGSCGRCTQTVLAGTPDHKDGLYAGTDHDGCVRVCVSRARGDSLTLDL